MRAAVSVPPVKAPPPLPSRPPRARGRAARMLLFVGGVLAGPMRPEGPEPPSFWEQRPGLVLAWAATVGTALALIGLLRGWWTI